MKSAYLLLNKKAKDQFEEDVWEADFERNEEKLSLFNSFYSFRASMCHLEHLEYCMYL